jgi:hypothetical protein
MMDWNRGEHARKFLKANGRYVQNETIQSGPVVFWGEWEPPSRVVETYQPDARGWPRLLHEPFWQVPGHRRLLQNTDPIVLGDRFLYSNCRQGKNRKLRELSAGSMVLFGSKLDGDFVLDTVFVVGDESQKFTRGSSEAVRCDDWVRAVVFEPLRMAAGPSTEALRLYRGRRYDEAPEGPFSFVPCRPWRSTESAFRRPSIRLDRHWIEPNLAMGAKATLVGQVQLRELWIEIVRQVVEVCGLAIAVQLEAPLQVPATGDEELVPELSEDDSCSVRRPC